MKAVLVIVLMSLGSLLARAAEVRGQIQSVVVDDGGQKIVLVRGAQTSVAYLQNSHPAFEALTELISLAQEGKKHLLISVDDEYLRFVKTVKIEN